MPSPPPGLRLRNRAPGGALIPSNPTATNRSCTTSARTCPRERSTHSSTLSTNGSINRDRRTGPATTKRQGLYAVGVGDQLSCQSIVQAQPGRLGGTFDDLAQRLPVQRGQHIGFDRYAGQHGEIAQVIEELRARRAGAARIGAGCPGSSG